MAKILGASVGVARATINTAAGVGERVVHKLQPNYVPPEVEAGQEVLSRFNGLFGLFNALDPNLVDQESSDERLESSVSWIAKTIVEEGFVDEHTAVELRSILPQESIWDKRLTRWREAFIPLLWRKLLEDQSVFAAIPNSLPITPSLHKDSPINPTMAWRPIASALDSFTHQMEVDSRLRKDPKRRLAVLAITDTDYEKKLFGPQLVTGGRSLDQPELVVLERVGRQPKENALVRVHRPEYAPRV